MMMCNTGLQYGNMNKRVKISPFCCLPIDIILLLLHSTNRYALIMITLCKIPTKLILHVIPQQMLQKLTLCIEGTFKKISLDA